MLVSFHLSRRVCFAILRHRAESSCWRARATLQIASVMHAIIAPMLCKIYWFKSKCADGNVLTKDIG